MQGDPIGLEGYELLFRSVRLSGCLHNRVNRGNVKQTRTRQVEIAVF